MHVPLVLRGLIDRVRRASNLVRRTLVVALLVVVYLLVVPWYWLWSRVVPHPAHGWKARHDSRVGSLDRLRRPF